MAVTKGTSMVLMQSQPCGLVNSTTRAERLGTAIAPMTNPDISQVYRDFPARLCRKLNRILDLAGASGLKAILTLPN